MVTLCNGYNRGNGKHFTCCGKKYCISACVCTPLDAVSFYSQAAQHCAGLTQERGLISAWPPDLAALQGLCGFRCVPSHRFFHAKISTWGVIFQAASLSTRSGTTIWRQTASLAKLTALSCTLCHQSKSSGNRCPHMVAGKEESGLGEWRCEKQREI